MTDNPAVNRRLVAASKRRAFLAQSIAELLEKNGPLATEDLAARLSMSTTKLRKLLVVLNQAGKVVRTTRSRSSVWSLPSSGQPVEAHKKHGDVNQARIRAALAKFGPMTTTQIAKRLDLPFNTAKSVAQRMCEDGKITFSREILPVARGSNTLEMAIKVWRLKDGSPPDADRRKITQSGSDETGPLSSAARAFCLS